MRLKEAIGSVSGLRYLVERLDLLSGPSRRCLYARTFCGDRKLLTREFDRIDAVMQYAGCAEFEIAIRLLKRELMQVKDVANTINALTVENVLDDIQLFEIKNFALVSNRILRILAGNLTRSISIPKLGEVVKLLDPEGQGVSNFYIYDCYAPELQTLRAEIRQRNNHDEGVEVLYEKVLKLEDEVRERLSKELAPFAGGLQEALQGVADLDILLAMAAQNREIGLIRPQLSESVTHYRGLFHPQIRAVLTAEGGLFQPVEISLGEGPSVVTGANMAGKTVLLKSLSLAQHLCQFGFYTPAEAAEIVPVEAVSLCIGDEQCELKGLSSFAAEMMSLDEILKRVKRGDHLLVLVDEAARTTNPTEGRAIVGAFLNLLTEYRCRAVVTTHYSGLEGPWHKLRVRGFVGTTAAEKITKQNLNRFMDYTLEEDAQGSVPHEALRIAAILGVDPELIAGAQTQLKNEELK